MKTTSINELYHHGVKGQKWGVHNGPPYPLDSKRVSEKVFRDAQKRSGQITKAVQSAAKVAGGSLYGLENKLKTSESIERKINKKASEGNLSVTDAANSIKDAVRFTVMAPDDTYVKVYNDFKKDLAKKGYTETSCKNYFDLFNKGKVKHKAVQSNFATDDGYEFEVQFHTPSSQDAKNKKLPLYNERRSSGLSESRKQELERQMEELALKVSDPVGIESIQTYDNSLKHSDIDDKKYGIPELKKFPMPDAQHVRSAIRFFNYVTPAYEEQLAKAILARMKEYGLTFDDFTVGKENRFSKYIPNDYLAHHGIKGQRWGIRRYQNPDGTYTEAGLRRLHRKDVRWAKRNYNKIYRQTYKKSKKEFERYVKKDLNKRESQLTRNGRKSKKYINEYNRKLAEVMNKNVSDIRSPNTNQTIKFIAKRGEMGVHLALAGEGFDMNSVRSGVYGDGRIAYKKNSVNMES